MAASQCLSCKLKREKDENIVELKLSVYVLSTYCAVSRVLRALS